GPAVGELHRRALPGAVRDLRPQQLHPRPEHRRAERRVRRGVRLLAREAAVPAVELGVRLDGRVHHDPLLRDGDPGLPHRPAHAAVRRELAAGPGRDRLDRHLVGADRARRGLPIHGVPVPPVLRLHAHGADRGRAHRRGERAGDLRPDHHPADQAGPADRGAAELRAGVEQLPVAPAGDDLGEPAGDPGGHLLVPRRGLHRLAPAHGRHHDGRCPHDHPVPDLPAVLRAGLRQLGDQVTAPAPHPPAPSAPPSVPPSAAVSAPDGGPAASGPLPSRAERGLGRRDPLEARGMVRFLTKPAAFFAANWAAMLGILTVIGIVPALAGATRVTGDLEQYEDEAFTSTLRHVRRTLLRDGPASLLLLLVLGGLVLNALVLPRLQPDLRVFAVGLMLPVLWVLVSVLSAYVAVASRDAGAERSEVMLRALALVMRRPVAALAAPALVVLLSPVWLLAPLTIACGFSVPPWIL